MIINGVKISKEQFIEYVANSNTKTELALKLRFTYFNGRVSKLITKYIKLFNCSIEHFDKTLKNKNRRKYPKIIKECPICKVEFETLKGNPREKTTCSSKCSNTYFSESKHSKSANEKRSKSLKSYHSFIIKDKPKDKPKDKICPGCNKQFYPKCKNRIYCSNKCSLSIRVKSPEYRKKLSDAMQKRIANGTHKGWATRKKCKPSYAEVYISSMLNDLGITYETERKEGRWFIDFADPNKKLALEIDGKQHNYPDRKKSDEKKDDYLISNGWKVLRIPWKKITIDFRNELLCRLYTFFD